MWEQKSAKFRKINLKLPRHFSCQITNHIFLPNLFWGAIYLVDFAFATEFLNPPNFKNEFKASSHFLNRNLHFLPYFKY